jgi:chromosomal replication initiation ATPase DnaA
MRLTILSGMRTTPDMVATVSLEVIAKAIFTRFPLTDYGKTALEALRSRRREQQLAEARQIFCAVARDAGWTATKVGEFLRRDHSTVLYSSTRAHEHMHGHVKAIVRSLSKGST